MDIPGLTYDVSHADPKARIERYIDAYRAQDAPDSFEVSTSPLSDSLCSHG